MIQLDFFKDEKTDLEYIHEDILKTKKSCDNVRKSLFAKHSELQKKYDELNQRLEIIEKNICLGSLF